MWRRKKGREERRRQERRKEEEEAEEEEQRVERRKGKGRGGRGHIKPRFPGAAPHQRHLCGRRMKEGRGKEENGANRSGRNSPEAP